MIRLRSLILGLTAVGLLAVASPAARADGGYGPFKGGPKYPTFFGWIHGSHSQPLPVYQAAPWYLYWPYDGHFLTPAPIGGAFYGAPVPGNFPVNPYFPGPAYGYPGPIPGGPAPGGVGPNVPPPSAPAPGYGAGYGYGGGYGPANIPMPVAPTGPAPRQ